MNIVVLFEKISLSDIKGNRDSFCIDLCNAGKILNSEKKDSNIDVKLLEGMIPNSSDDEKVVILISSDKMMTNMGKYMVAFKLEALKAFSKVGIPLDKQSLSVKMNAPYDIDKLVKKVGKMQNKERDLGTNSETDEFDYAQKAKQYSNGRIEWGGDWTKKGERHHFNVMGWQRTYKKPENLVG